MFTESGTTNCRNEIHDTIRLKEYRQEYSSCKDKLSLKGLDYLCEAEYSVNNCTATQIDQRNNRYFYDTSSHGIECIKHIYQATT